MTALKYKLSLYIHTSCKIDGDEGVKGRNRQSVIPTDITQGQVNHAGISFKSHPGCGTFFQIEPGHQQSVGVTFQDHSFRQAHLRIQGIGKHYERHIGRLIDWDINAMDKKIIA